MDKSWRERIAEAERRARWVPPPLRNIVATVGYMLFDSPWPFTKADLQAWRNVQMCPAGEARHAHGLYFYVSGDLFRIGNQILQPLVLGRVKRVAALVNAIEDRALQLKREELDLAR